MRKNPPTSRILRVYEVQQPTHDRSFDRRLTVLGLVAAAALMVAAVLLGLIARVPPWSAVHLMLAGGATVAVASVLPFMMAGVLVVPPARALLRIGAVVALATGNLLVVLGMSASLQDVALLGAIVMLAGLAVLLAIVGLLLRGASGPRRVFAFFAGVAVLNVICGVSLAAAYLSGTVSSAAWLVARPAHVWLNLLGFLVLVVAVALNHLYSMTIAARVTNKRISRIGLGLLAVGPPSLAVGQLTNVDIVLKAGAAMEIVGVLAFGWSILDAWRRRGRWSSDPGWHWFAARSMEAATSWITVALLVAAARAFNAGPGPDAWHANDVILPLVAGGLIQVILGAWTQLVPTIGPGSPARHARQRAILAFQGTPRLILYNAALIGLVLAPPLAPGATAALGWLASAVALSSVGLFAASVVVGPRSTPSAVSSVTAPATVGAGQ